jgi:uracil-DNA glycosylase
MDNILEHIPQTWSSYLLNEELKNIVATLSEDEISKSTPPPHQWFEFARHVEPRNIRVVILGQDPYPTKGHAHGLAFSYLGDGSLPGSLRNIFKCLHEQGLISVIPTSGDLTPWASQGILLLNTALTTRIGETKSHVKIWSKFTRNIIKKLSEQVKPIFVLWGNDAKQYEAFIEDDCSVLQWCHPSPLTGKKFLSCTNFHEINLLLEKKNMGAINWNIEKTAHPVEKEFMLNDSISGLHVIFTDGSCYPNKSCPDSRGGYAAEIVYGICKETIIAGNLDISKYFATNIRAEGQAILSALKYIHEMDRECAKIIIYSDSELWIKMIKEYIPAWAKKDSTLKSIDKKNMDLVIELWGVCKKLRLRKVELEFNHVRSHQVGWKSKDAESYEYFCGYHNDYVDKYAEWARLHLSPSDEHIRMVAYEEDEEDEEDVESKEDVDNDDNESSE